MSSYVPILKMQSAEDEDVTTPLNINFGNESFLNIEPDETHSLPIEPDSLVEPHSFIQHNTSSSSSKYLSLPEPGSIYGNHSSHRHVDSTSTILTDNSSALPNRDVEKEPQRTKRGWRFYGTFTCLALLNFTCAIDATILSVALPVGHLFINLLRILSY